MTRLDTRHTIVFEAAGDRFWQNKRGSQVSEDLKHNLFVVLVAACSGLAAYTVGWRAGDAAGRTAAPTVVPAPVVRSPVAQPSNLSAEMVAIVAHLRQRAVRPTTVEVLARGKPESPAGAELYSAPTATPEKMTWRVIGVDVFADKPPTVAQRVRFRGKAPRDQWIEDEWVYLLRDGDVVVHAPLSSYRPASAKP